MFSVCAVQIFISIHHNIDQILFRDVLNQNIFFRESCFQLKCFCKWQQQSFPILYGKPLSKKNEVSH